MLRLQPPVRRLMLQNVILPLMLAGCATEVPIAGISPEKALPTACTDFARITYSRLMDTEDTLIQLKAYDAARDAICGVGK